MKSLTRQTCLLLFAISWAIAGCSSQTPVITSSDKPSPLISEATQTPAPAPQTTELPQSTLLPPTPTATLPALAGPLATYSDEQVGFALDYPASWTLTGVADDIKQSSSIYSAVLTSWKPSGPGTEGIPEGETKIDITVFNQGAKSLDEALMQLKRQYATSDPVTTVLSTERLTLPSGLPAARWEVESLMGRAVEMICVIDGKTVILSGLGDYTTFDQVARTLRQIN